MLLVYGIAITFSVLFSGIFLVKQVYSDPASEIRVASHAPPSSAEPSGRAWGPQDAPIQVLAYTDYACESCESFAATYEHELVNTHAQTGKVRHETERSEFHGEGAKNAAQAAICAADQNSFWPMHSSLFLNQPPINAPANAGFTAERLTTLAERLNLNIPIFSQYLTSGKYRQQIEDALVETQRSSVWATPTFVVNGTSYAGLLPLDRFRQIFNEVAPDVTFN